MRLVFRPDTANCLRVCLCVPAHDTTSCLTELKL